LRTRSSLLRVVSRRELMLASDCPRECAGTSATIASAASVSAAATAAGRLFGAAPAIVLFPALTGLAVGLALKESRYAGPPAISPRAPPRRCPLTSRVGSPALPPSAAVRLSAFGLRLHLPQAICLQKRRNSISRDE